MSRKPRAENREPEKNESLSFSLQPSAFSLAFALAFGLFLGLCIWKFGNPVILDQKILPPTSLSEWLHDPWPTHWAAWIFFPLAGAGACLALKHRADVPTRFPDQLNPAVQHQRWLWLLPLLWLGWQMVSSLQADAVNSYLVIDTLWQFFGCVGCYFLGSTVLGHPKVFHWLLIGILTAFAFCLVRAVDQRLIEFPHSQQTLLEGEKAGWTNLPPEMFQQMKQEGIIVATNGMDIANPVVLKKLQNGRVMGTLVYPNALAGLILLLLPVSLVLACTQKLRPLIRTMVLVLAGLLGGLSFIWSGSKFGWLIAMGVGGLCLFRRPWPLKWKMSGLALVVVLGLGIFAIRFHHYFAAGATSAGARLDYWRAAVKITADHPFFGTGPGTFQRPYAKLKAPDAEMTRLTHNDYLEQFCDSGVPGGIFYAGWIFLALITVGRHIWKHNDLFLFAIFIGVLAWFGQGLGEFSLYVPALAWIAFTFLGCLVSNAANQFDNKPARA